LSYAEMSANHSLLNTPPVFAIYMVGLVARYLIDEGGLSAIADRNAEKATCLYAALDESEGFYQGCAHLHSRSLMNATFRLPTQELETQFVSESEAAGFVGLQGHRSVGGIRVSLYNAITIESVQALIDFMEAFRQRWH
jgi:phosphoserine aminotransferase